MLLPIFFLSFLLFAMGDCPANSTSQEGVCYKVFNTTILSWFDAEAACIIDGGNLASIPDAFASTYIANLAKPILGFNNYWVGGLAQSNNVTNVTFWEWLDYASFKYTNWAPGEPVNSDPGSCVVQNPFNTKWASVDCTSLKPYVCEYTNSSKACPTPDYTHFTAFNSKCIKLYNNSQFIAWDNAQSICSQFGSLLVSIHSGQEEAVYTSILKRTSGITKSGYIGLYDPNQNGSFKWIDDTPLDYTFFRGGFPPGLGECGYMNDGYEYNWFTMPCHEDDLFYFICEYFYDQI